MQFNLWCDESTHADGDRQRAMLVEEANALVQPIIRGVVEACAARLRKVYDDLPHLDLDPPFEFVLAEQPLSGEKGILATSFIYLIEPGSTVENRLLDWDGNRRENDPVGHLRIQVNNDRRRTIFINIEPEVGSLPPSLTYPEFPHLSILALHIPTVPLDKESVSLELDWTIVTHAHYTMMSNTYQTARHRGVPCVPFAEVPPVLRPLAICPPLRQRVGLQQQRSLQPDTMSPRLVWNNKV